MPPLSFDLPEPPKVETLKSNGIYAVYIPLTWASDRVSEYLAFLKEKAEGTGIRFMPMAKECPLAKFE